MSDPPLRDVLREYGNPIPPHQAEDNRNRGYQADNPNREYQEDNRSRGDQDDHSNHAEEGWSEGWLEGTAVADSNVDNGPGLDQQVPAEEVWPENILCLKQ